MIKYCLNKWDKNRERLEAAIRADKQLNECDYKHLVKLVVDNILNGAGDEYETHAWDSGSIIEIDNGDYQGTLLYLIPESTYQPSEGEYLMTYVGYGSCSGCDALQSIQCYYDYYDDSLREKQIGLFMTLCRDILSHIIKPYNNGWRHDKDFDQVEEE